MQTQIMMITFNTAVTETAHEILGKHHQKKKSLVTADILDLFDKRKKQKQLRKKDPQGSEIQHQNVHEKGKTKLDRKTV